MDTLGNRWHGLFHCQGVKQILVSKGKEKLQRVCILCVLVPDCVSYNTELCPWLAGSDGLVSAAPRRFHQAPPDLIHLADQEGLRGVTMVTIQIHLQRVKKRSVNCCHWSRSCLLGRTKWMHRLTVTSMLMMSPSWSCRLQDKGRIFFLKNTHYVN